LNIYIELSGHEEFMDQTSVTQSILNMFEGVETATAQGYTFFFYDPDRALPFVTLVTQDNEYDRPSVFRLKVGVSRATYKSLFGTQSPRLSLDGVVDTGHDFTTLDQLMRHPIYAPQSWVCVLNPSEATLQTLQPLLSEAYTLAVKRHSKARPGTHPNRATIIS
jgi:hypothetical protein